jgi:microcystin-dependent protein
MADVREILDPIEAIASMQARLDDLEMRLSSQAVRLPTGTILSSFRTTPPSEALFCDGSTISRATYPALLQFAIDQGILGGAIPVFGVGDGSTTFILPNLQGRMIIGVGTLGADTYTLGLAGGSTLKTLVTANMPAHTHGVAVGAHGNHNHFFSAGTDASGGNHGGHFPVGQHLAAAGPDLGLAANNDTSTGNSAHGHNVSGNTDSVSAGSHSVTESSVGGTTGIDVRSAYYALNSMVYT